MKLSRKRHAQRKFGAASLVQRLMAYPVRITIFAVLSLCFSFLFVNMTVDAKVMAPPHSASIVSMKGKRSVSIPPGIKSVPTNSKKPSSTQSVQSNLSRTSIPSKPQWVTMSLYTDPSNTAAQYVQDNPSADGVQYINKMSQRPVAQWFGDWDVDVTADANQYVSAASAAGKVPVLVAYNIPNRDCGGYSVGGASGVAQYTSWVQRFANGIGDRTAVVILEPDALGAVDCLPSAAQSDRYASLAGAVTILKSHPRTSVYIDAGTPVWQPAQTMAVRLQQANVAAADGFSLNVSYFASTASNRVYGDTLSQLIGNKHYVIDSSRNGTNQPVSGMLCNPSFASFGSDPTTNTGNERNDALLWIKIPWESDGECNGSPGPGMPYWSYAIQLAKNAGW